MEKKETAKLIGIERGIISQKKSDASAVYVYKVKSQTRDNIESRWMEAACAYTHEWKGEPPARDEYEYSVGDLVNYFMFPDGRGMILGKVRKDL